MHAHMLMCSCGQSEILDSSQSPDPDCFQTMTLNDRKAANETILPIFMVLKQCEQDAVC